MLSRNHGNSISEERIWQVALGDGMRGADSQEFEARNDEWAYTVCKLRKIVTIVTS